MEFTSCFEVLEVLEEGRRVLELDWSRGMKNVVFASVSWQREEKQTSDLRQSP